MSALELSTTQSLPQSAAMAPTPERVTAIEDLHPAMPYDRLERVEAWGMNTSVLSYVYRPSTVEDIKEVFEIARRHGLKVGLRGAGRSYGDASLLAENICLDLTRMNRILDWNPQTGRITVEPGVTVRQIWQY